MPAFNRACLQHIYGGQRTKLGFESSPSILFDAFLLLVMVVVWVGGGGGGVGGVGGVGGGSTLE